VTDAVFEIADLLIRKTSARTTFELAVPHLQIARGEKIALVGPSGCGKSTLLDALSMISRPDRVGVFRLAPDGSQNRPPPIDVARLLNRNDAGRLAVIRKRWIGYVLQTGGLLSFLSVRRNIEISRRLLGLRDDGTVESVARRLGILDHLRKLPSALSVGERQRVAIARALAHRPSIIVADEPTAALDPRNAEIVMESFVEVADEFRTTTIIASHDLARVAKFGLRLVEPTLATDAGSATTRALFSG
jgi:putative ABC transport system ATP-binding protein